MADRADRQVVIADENEGGDDRQAERRPDAPRRDMRHGFFNLPRAVMPEFAIKQPRGRNENYDNDQRTKLMQPLLHRGPSSRLLVPPAQLVEFFQIVDTIRSKRRRWFKERLQIRS